MNGGILKDSRDRKGSKLKTKKTPLWFLICCLSYLCCLWTPAVSFAVPPPLPQFPPLEFHPPKPEKIVLDNGLTIFLLEDHELPLIKLSATFRMGSQYEPPEKLGISGIFGSAMTQGGSQTRSPEDIEQSLDRKAASVDFSVGLENGSGSLSCRKEDFDSVFTIFADLLQHPLFRKDYVELAKEQALEGLRRMNDDPEEVARREFRKIMYGPAHPYARTSTPDTVRTITREDLLAMHKRYVLPNATWIAVSGDFDGAAMKEKLKKALGAWPRGALNLPPIAPVPPAPKRRVYYIQRSIDQSQIRTGEFGLARHNPDHFAWEVFNELWGGSGASRLFRTVRTRMGLAYAVGSGYSEPTETGLIVAISQTRAAQTIAAVQAIEKITADVSQAPFTTEEIRSAKESIRNRFVENYTSSSQIVNDIMNNDYFGFPSDYIDTYTANVGKVTAQDLARVAKKYLHPDQTNILVMGDLPAFDRPITTLGPAQEIHPPDFSKK